MFVESSTWITVLQRYMRSEQGYTHCLRAGTAGLLDPLGAQTQIPPVSDLPALAVQSDAPGLTLASGYAALAVASKKRFSHAQLPDTQRK